jgi:hypothetical protein
MFDINKIASADEESIERLKNSQNNTDNQK